MTFSDISIEPGIGGIAESGQKLYVYGSATVVASGTWGQDIYQRNDSMHVAVEKAYAGLLWVPEKDKALNASLGRQNYTLNDGFLIHHVKGSTNVGDRRAVFLGARTAHDMTALLSGRYEGWGIKAFYLDPNEYESLESNSKFAGGNVRYDVGNGLTIDGTYIENVHSDSSFATPQGTRVPREGISTTAAHLRWRNALGTPGLFIESEIGHQRSSRADVSASAGYASAGYRFKDARWSPALVVRYSQWSGDRPETARYERWDPLLPAGSDEWMGGMIFSKYVSNSNLQQLRMRFFAEPTQAFNFTVDWFKYQAMEANNLGANPVLSTLQSRDLGNELMFTGRWYVGKNYYVQTLASINWPGEAIRRALPEPTRPGRRCRRRSTGSSDTSIYLQAAMAPDAAVPFERLFTLLFMMMGPAAVMPVFAVLTEGAAPKLSRRIAFRAAFFAGIAVALAVLLGYGVLTSWGATPASLVIAGGLLLLLSALQTTMMRPMPAGPGPAQATAAEPSLAIALSPLAFPGIVAPHAIGVLIIFAAYLHDRASSSQYSQQGWRWFSWISAGCSWPNPSCAGSAMCRCAYSAQSSVYCRSRWAWSSLSTASPGRPCSNSQAQARSGAAFPEGRGGNRVMVSASTDWI